MKNQEQHKLNTQKNTTHKLNINKEALFHFFSPTTRRSDYRYDTQVL